MAHIKTYARLKPSKRPYPGYEIHNNNCLKVYIPDNKDFLTDPQQMIRSSLSYEVKFTEIFKPEATQEQVFDVAARDIIQSFLNGYNGTLFAYGQTGTGKTYTVEGNPTLHSSRGLCTRALSMIYEQLEKRRDDLVYVHLSYMEVYQEVVYDLLNPITNPSISLIPFAKVTVYEGPRDSCILRGLTLHKAVNEEIAQMFLLQGQTNRKIAETPVNQRSSRSHAVFTVYLQIHKHDSQVVLNSKLHLVDLAGSERVSKTGVDGQQLTEAKSINLSLHHLETVIIALQSERSVCSMEDRSKDEMSLLHIRSNTSFTSGPSSDSFNRSSGYVPYRNSLLTMILKDSLGGNCLTAMIATISMEPENVGESISTCRFAQRVARVSNNARRNEAVDDKTLIKQLKRKVVSLKHQLAVLQTRLCGKNPSVQRFHESQSSALTAKDKAVCAQIMHDYLHGTIQNPLDAGICERGQFIECLNVLKQHCLHSRAMSSQPDSLQQHLPRPPMIDIGMFSDAFHKLGDLSTQDYSDSGSYSMILCPQCPTGLTASDISLDNSDEYYSASDNQALANTDCQNMGPYFKLHGGNHCRKSSDKMKSWALKKSNRNLPTSQKVSGAKTDIQAETRDRYLQKLHQLESTYRQRLHRLEEDNMKQQSILYSLKRSRADSQQVADAQFTEQQLLRRQASMQDKLNKILEKKRQFFAAYPSEKPKSLAAKRTGPKSTYETMSSPRQARDSKQAGPAMSKGCDTDHHKKESKSEKLSTRPKKFTFKDAASLGRDLRKAQHKLKIASDHPARAQKVTSQPPTRSTKKAAQTAAEREEVTASTELELASPAMGLDRYPAQTPSLDHLPERSPTHQLACCSQETLSKEESFSETSQSTEKQVKPIEDYMVQDDLQEGDHAKDNNSRSMKHT